MVVSTTTSKFLETLEACSACPPSSPGRCGLRWDRWFERQNFVEDVQAQEAAASCSDLWATVYSVDIFFFRICVRKPTMHNYASYCKFKLLSCHQEEFKCFETPWLSCNSPILRQRWPWKTRQKSLLRLCGYVGWMAKAWLSHSRRIFVELRTVFTVSRVRPMETWTCFFDVSVVYRVLFSVRSASLTSLETGEERGVQKHQAFQQRKGFICM